MSIVPLGGTQYEKLMYIGSFLFRFVFIGLLIWFLSWYIPYLSGSTYLFDVEAHNQNVLRLRALEEYCAPFMFGVIEDLPVECFEVINK